VGYLGECKQNTEPPPDRRLSQQLRDYLSLHGEGLGQTKGFIVELSRVSGHLDPTT
jgi:hypothetical protein